MGLRPPSVPGPHGLPRLQCPAPRPHDPHGLQVIISTGAPVVSGSTSPSLSGPCMSACGAPSMGAYRPKQMCGQALAMTEFMWSASVQSSCFQSAHESWRAIEIDESYQSTSRARAKVPQNLKVWHSITWLHLHSRPTLR